ncbi:PIG-L family deacetylase [Dactylosporangium roseum]|uniref:PIG-L family deacetylase n=1 Tax=Dactylosporangium roseum TaxID=47989 RepID=A0ABY5ZB39_9ACTN|nr:PIG-L family deacetylase [Dactylosporangium roseum]UWZ39305.1 PIG-L family deacetylase [Dactylosporangium roseum]
MTGAGTPPHYPLWSVVAVSTHFDDVVLSLGGFLLGVGAPKAIATVHGQAPAPGDKVSEWDAECGFTTAAEAFATRREEDRRACELLGADQVLLPNPDNPYRPDGPLAGLDELFAGLDPNTRVLLPIGVNQPDHAAVRDAALDALDRLDRRPPWFYADLPYAAALVPDWRDATEEELSVALDRNDHAYRELRSRLGVEPRPGRRIDDRTWQRKRQAIFSYSSQLSLVGAMGEVQHMGPMLRFPGAMQREFIVAAPSARGADGVID